MRRRTDKVKSRMLSALLAVVAVGVVCGIAALGVIVSDVTGRKIGAATRREIKATSAKIAESSHDEVLGGCVRSNQRTLITNRSALNLWTFLTRQAFVVASDSTDPHIRELAKLDLALASQSVWQPLTNCAVAVPAGPKYKAPAAFPFDVRLPPKSDVAASSSSTTTPSPAPRRLDSPPA